MQDSLFSAGAQFPVSFRLLRRDGFDHVIHASSVTDKHFKVFFVKNCKQNARLGIVASKRVLACASARNRVKRVVRETFRNHNIRFYKVDLVVMLKYNHMDACSQSQFLGRLLTQVENRCAEL